MDYKSYSRGHQQTGLSPEEIALMKELTDHQIARGLTNNNNNNREDSFPDHRIGLIPTSSDENGRYKKRVNYTRSPKRLSYLEAQNNQVFSVIEGNRMNNNTITPESNKPSKIDRNLKKKSFDMPNNDQRKTDSTNQIPMQVPRHTYQTSPPNTTSPSSPNHSLYIKMPSPAFEYILQGDKRRGKRRLHWCLWSAISLVCLLLIVLSLTYIVSQYYKSQNSDKLVFRPTIYEWAYKQFNRRPNSI